MISTKGDIVSTIFLCCDGVCTVHYCTYQFSARNGPNGEAQFFATAFLDENRSNRKNNQTNTNRMMGWIENRPNKFLNQNFVRQTLPPKQSMSPFNFTSLILCNNQQCNAAVALGDGGGAMAFGEACRAAIEGSGGAGPRRKMSDEGVNVNVVQRDVRSATNNQTKRA